MISKTCKFRVHLYKGLIRIILNYTAEPVCHVFNLNVILMSLKLIDNYSSLLQDI